MTALRISVIITTYNEGAQVERTVRSVLENTAALAEVIVLDDGSTDGSCQGLSNGRVRVIRHEQRIGVAASRDEGSRLAAGNVLCYLDAHQRLQRNCLDRCGKVALDSEAICTPDIRNFGLLHWRLYGADFCLHPERGYFTGRWRTWRWRRTISPVTALRAPPYLLPRALYPKIAWSRELRGWGASEACVGVKAFFTGTPILHYGGPLALHLFRGKFHYDTTWEGVWRNHALIARICFGEATWSRYWFPQVFAPHLTEEVVRVIDSAEVQAEHEAFQAMKVRTDREFWTDLVRVTPPADV